ncbi:MAG: FAD-dependent oxidoreductase, partial [Chloroflexia bacterium]|nr:FAD-dependent oxidoreductase [Chloroflexia bacterium]
SGRVLADLITGADTPLTKLPMTHHRSRRWEPEPFRWLGYQFVAKSRQRYLRQAEERGGYPEKPTLAQRIWKF